MFEFVQILSNAGFNKVCIFNRFYFLFNFYHTNNEEVFRHQELCDHYLQHETAIPIVPSKIENIKFKNLKINRGKTIIKMTIK